MADEGNERDLKQRKRTDAGKEDKNDDGRIREKKKKRGGRDDDNGESRSRRRNREESSSDDSGDRRKKRKEDDIDGDRNGRKKKRRDEEYSGDEDGSRRKRQRDSKTKKKDKSKRKRDSSDESEDESSGEERRRKRKELKKAKKLLRELEKAKLGSSSGGKPPSETISDDDYFARNREFATWLKEDRQIFFSSLTSEASRSLFSEFVAAWNRGSLPASYYSGDMDLEAAPRSGHNWRLKTDAAEARGLAAAQQAQVEQEEAWAARAQQMKLERRRGRKEAEVAMEEMMPRATGREARVEARVARRVEKREREASPELMKDKDLLGGGDDFQSRLAREKAWREKRARSKEDAVREKQTVYESKESEKMEALRAMIAMAGGKITIAKRSDT